jgi:TM2 domain-containing membrane protein YozV
LFKNIFLTTFLFFILLHGKSKAIGHQEMDFTSQIEQFSITPSDQGFQFVNKNTSKKIKLINLLQKATVENKKVTAAVLTLTLGMLGVHRIYLGTAPYIPAVYLFTFGGGFFILPIVDLVMILSTNDITKFENNNKLLMWTGE